MVYVYPCFCLCCSYTCSRSSVLVCVVVILGNAYLSQFFAGNQSPMVLKQCLTAYQHAVGFYFLTEITFGPVHQHAVFCFILSEPCFYPISAVLGKNIFTGKLLN